MIKEEYVTLDTSKLLNEAGFPYDDTDPCYEERIGLCGREYYPKPTQAQAMRWLRDVGLMVSPEYKYDGAWWISLRSERFNLYKALNNADMDENLPNYEAAAEVGIQAACKYLIEKGVNQ